MAMDNESERLIREAVRLGYITSRQAELLRDEMEMFPGQNLGTLMVRRNMITQQQLAILRNAGSPPPSGSPSPSGAGTMPPPLGRGTVVPGLAPQPLNPQPAPPPPVAPAASPLKPPKPVGAGAKIVDYLRMARECKASDLHLCTGRQPFVRQGGRLVYLDEPPLSPERAKALNTEAMTAQQLEVLERDLQIDFSLSVPGLGRHRCNVFHSRLGVEGAYRIIRDTVPSIQELGLPEVC
jgi:hypothetical protein